jgi:hypothetical protein
MQLAGIVEQTAEQIASTNLARLILPDNRQPSRSVRCLKPERPMRTMPVVVLDIDPQDLRQVASSDDQEPVRHSARTVRTHRSAYAFALGARTGVISTWAPSEQNTSSKLRENFAS